MLRSPRRAGPLLTAFLLLATLAALCWPLPARAGGPPPITFTAPTHIPTAANGPGDVDTADLDGDGHLDLVTQIGPGVTTLYGDGTGAFTMAGDYPVGNSINQVLPADVNGDGRPDLVVTWIGGGEVAVLLNLGGRAFGPAAYYPVGTRPFGVAAGYFNADNRLDLAVANDESHNISILLNAGGGTFGPATNIGAGSFPAHIVATELNGDNRTDLAMSNYVSGDVMTYFGNGQGGFTRSGTYKVGDYPAQLVVTDFNRDGRPDIATANTFSHNVSVLLGTGGGLFAAAVTYPGYSYPHIMRAADFDGDGFPDLAVPNSTTDSWSFYRSLGNGGLAAAVRFFTGGKNLRTLAAGDYNEDGQPDVAVGDEEAFQLSIFLNTTRPGAPLGLKVQASVRGRLDLTWQARSAGDTGYEIERRGVSGGFSPRASVGAGVTSYQDQSLPDSTFFAYRVRALRSGAPSAWSAEAGQTTLAAPPDTRAPDLTSPTATPDSLPSGGGPVTLTVMAGDNVGVTSARAEVTKPDGSKQTVSLTRDSGDALLGRYRGTFNTPANTTTAALSYSAAFFARDAAGNEGTASEARRFTVAGRDVAPPALGGASVNPPTLPAAGGPVNLSVTATDNNGVTRVQATVKRPDNSQLIVLLALTGGTSASGTWTGTTTLPPNPGSSQQTYLVGFTGFDAAGNAAGVAPIQTVVAANDPTPPALSAPKATPTSLPATGGPVTLSVTAADAVGVTAVRAEVTGPGGKTTVALALKSGTPTNGSYAGTYPAPANQTASVQSYSVRFFATDGAGNQGSSATVSFTLAKGTPPKGKLLVSTTSLNFGSQLVSSRTKLTFEVSNGGAGVLKGSVGKPLAPFSVTQGSGAFTLTAGQKRLVEVQFAPTVRRSAPPFTGQLTITSDDPARRSAVVSVRGTSR